MMLPVVIITTLLLASLSITISPVLSLFEDGMFVGLDSVTVYRSPDVGSDDISDTVRSVRHIPALTLKKKQHFINVSHHTQYMHNISLYSSHEDRHLPHTKHANNKLYSFLMSWHIYTCFSKLIQQH